MGIELHEKLSLKSSSDPLNYQNGVVGILTAWSILHFCQE